VFVAAVFVVRSNLTLKENLKIHKVVGSGQNGKTFLRILSVEL